MDRENSTFAQALDAIVLAGTHRDPKHSILGKNKAFLELDGRPLIRHVVDALLASERIDQVFAVGPVDEMRDALAGMRGAVHLVPQEGNMLANCWAGVKVSEKLRDQESAATRAMRPYLIISSDLPLISALALDDFVARCAADDYASEVPHALMVGVVDETAVAPFEPTADKPGIRRPFVQLEFARLRLANIYVARPRVLVHQDFLQTGFNFRKAINWRNVVGLAFSILSQKGGFAAAWLTLRLQATLLASRRGGGLYRWLRRGNTRQRVEAACSKVIGSPLRLIVTPYGGLSLDVDDESDFAMLDAHYGEWIAIHNATQSDILPPPIAEPAAGRSGN